MRAGCAGLKRALSASEVASPCGFKHHLWTLAPVWPPSLAVWFVSRSSFIKGPEGALGEVSVTLETRGWDNTWGHMSWEGPGGAPASVRRQGGARGLRSQSWIWSHDWGFYGKVWAGARAQEGLD